MRHFYWIDPANNELQLGNTPQSFVSSYSGMGYAPLEHFLQGIPSQHRQFYRGMKFRPRTIQLAIWDFRTSNTEQDNRHQTLLEYLNAEKGEGTLKVILDGGTERRIGCYVSQGPDFDSEGRRDWFQSYIVRFLARDPFFYNPSQQSASDNFNGATPVDVSVDNAGHVDTFPVITITGAVNKPKALLVTTGEYIEFNYNLTAGHHIDIDCAEGTINYDDVEMSPLTLTKQSTLFSIPTGLQTIRLTATAGAGAFSVSWYSRFLGI